MRKENSQGARVTLLAGELVPPLGTRTNELETEN